MKKRKFWNWSKWATLSIFLFIVYGCANKRSLASIEKNDTTTLFFLDFFESDQVRIYDGKTKILDTVISTHRTIGMCFIREFNFKNNTIKVKFNNDTAFSIQVKQDSFNNFLFNKTNETYTLTEARDTTIVSM